MLHEKDQLFNWVIPEKNQSCKINDFRVNLKNQTLYIGYNFMAANFPGVDLSIVKVAFLLNGDKQFLVINPPDGVPFYKFISYPNMKTKKHYSPTIGNKQLTALFKQKFLITTLVKDFKLNKFENINGMVFYQIIPI
jgi:hypothetical protein